jgi:predicted secreted protein with PEFG-CTERM motif
MKMSTLSSLFVLMSVVSMIAIAPSAFADETVTNAPGSSTPGCEPNCFVPSTVTIEAGETVTWDNTDTAAHTATSGSTSDSDSVGAVFDSSLIMAGGSYSHTFDTPGTYVYFCMVHPWMEGTVIVEAAGAADAAAAEAAAEAAAAEAAAADAAADADAAAEAAAAEAAAAIAALEAEQAAKEAAAAAMAGPSLDAADYISASGASVTSITANADDDSVIIVIDAVDDGTLSVQLHDKIIRAFDDGTYFVLIDNEEVWFEQSGTDLTIPYEAGNEKIEIVGSYAVPEFGTIAMIILAVAIVSIIAITAKTRMTLIPKL